MVRHAPVRRRTAPSVNTVLNIFSIGIGSCTDVGGLGYGGRELFPITFKGFDAKGRFPATPGGVFVASTFEDKSEEAPNTIDATLQENISGWDVGLIKPRADRRSRRVLGDEGGGADFEIGWVRGYPIA